MEFALCFNIHTKIHTDFPFVINNPVTWFSIFRYCNLHALLGSGLKLADMKNKRRISASSHICVCVI